MPGQYNFDDFFVNMLKKPQLSSMRAPPRKGLVDEHANALVAPGIVKFFKHKSNLPKNNTFYINF